MCLRPAGLSYIVPNCTEAVLTTCLHPSPSKDAPALLFYCGPILDKTTDLRLLLDSSWSQTTRLSREWLKQDLLRQQKATKPRSHGPLAGTYRPWLQTAIQEDINESAVRPVYPNLQASTRTELGSPLGHGCLGWASNRLGCCCCDCCSLQPSCETI